QTLDADSVVFEYLVQPERGSLMRQQAEQLGSVHREGCVILGGESVSDGQLAPPFLGSSGSLERLNGSTSRFVHIGFVDSGLAVPCGVASASRPWFCALLRLGGDSRAAGA